MMHSNTEVCGGSWRPLRKPDYYAVEHKARDLLVQVRQLWPLTNDAQFFSETVPYMSRLMSTLALTAGNEAHFKIFRSKFDLNFKLDSFSKKLDHFDNHLMGCLSIDRPEGVRAAGRRVQ